MGRDRERREREREREGNRARQQRDTTPDHRIMSQHSAVPHAPWRHAYILIGESRARLCSTARAGRGPVQGPLLSGPWTGRSLCLLKRSPFAQKKGAFGMWERQSYTQSQGRTARVHGPRGFAARAVDAAVLPSSLCRIVHFWSGFLFQKNMCDDRLK